jgi:hypothetical protein
MNFAEQLKRAEELAKNGGSLVMQPGDTGWGGGWGCDSVEQQRAQERYRKGYESIFGVQPIVNWREVVAEVADRAPNYSYTSFPYESTEQPDGPELADVKRRLTEALKRNQATNEKMATAPAFRSYTTQYADPHGPEMQAKIAEFNEAWRRMHEKPEQERASDRVFIEFKGEIAPSVPYVPIRAEIVDEYVMTPGPWYVDDYSHGRLWIRRDEEDESITTIVQDVDNPADAQVIAAAPTMLAVLEGIVAIYDANCGELIGDDIETCRQAIRLAREIKVR